MTQLAVSRNATKIKKFEVWKTVKLIIINFEENGLYIPTFFFKYVKMLLVFFFQVKKIYTLLLKKCLSFIFKLLLSNSL